MTSAVQIANLALVILGDDEALVELNSDTRAGRTILAVFDALRDAVLRAHPWNFAIARASLPALSDAPSWGYQYAYQLPSDWLRFVDEDEYQPYSIEGNKLLTDAVAPLNIRYVRRVTDPGLFDALFVQALAARIAAQVALRLTGSDSIRQTAMAAFTAAMAEAKKVDGQENPPEDYPEDDWVIAREAE